MKKVLMIMFMLLFVSLFNLNRVSADDLVYYSLIKNETKSGEEINFERNNENLLFRVTVDNNVAIDIDLEGKNIQWIFFLESTSYYLYYGSLMTGYDIMNTVPFIVRIEKDLSDYKIITDLNTTGSAYYMTILEFNMDEFIVTELYDGVFNYGVYDGYCRLISMDKDLSMTTSIECGKVVAKTSIVYDTIEVVRQDTSISYFDKEFNLLDTYLKEITYYGNFTLSTETIVDGVKYPLGTSFNIPGTYVLSDGVHDNRIVTLKPIVTGVKNEGEYRSVVRFKVSGGDVYLNDEPIYLNGVVSEIGEYTIKIKGNNDYVENISFRILPTLISDIETGDILAIGDEIKFKGSALLNGEEITSGYIIETGGSYELNLVLNGKVEETIYFTVNEAVISENNKIWIYIVAGSAAILLSVGIFFIVKNRRKHQIRFTR